MCQYCDGNRTPLPLDTFATDSDLFVVEAVLEGVDERNPAIGVNADGAWIYVRARFCPECGRKLGESCE